MKSLLAITLAAGLGVASAFASVEGGPGRNGVVAFTRVEGNGTSAIFTIDPRSRRFRRLTGPYSPPPSLPVWAPDGLITYSSYLDGRITRVDPRSGRTRSLPRGVRSEEGFAWSPDGSRVVLQRGAGLVIVTRGGKLLRRLTRSSSDHWPAWSPNGRTIAFERSIDGIFLVAADASGLRKLGAGSEPAWSPDGRQLVISDSAPCPGCLYSELFLVNVDGNGRRQLTFGCRSEAPAWAPASRIAVSCNQSLALVDPATGVRTDLGTTGFGPSWSRDGLRLVVYAGEGLKVVDVAERSVHALSLVPREGSDGQPAWAADGRSLAVAGTSSVRILTARGNRVRTLPGAFAEPSWAPDGRRLIALTDDCCTWSIVDLRTGSQDDVLVDVGAGDPTPCSPAWSPGGRWIAFSQTESLGLGLYDVRRRRERSLTFGGSHPDWAPSGRRLAFDTTEECVGGPSRRASVFVARIDGSGRRRLARNASDPTWSPDGRRIAFVRIVGRNNPEIYVMNADGSRQRRLTHHPGADVAPDWQRRPGR